MSNLSTEALSMATKLAAEQLKKSNHDIKLLKETVATQATPVRINEPFISLSFCKRSGGGCYHLTISTFMCC